MSITVLIFLFCILEVVTPLVVEGIKKVLDSFSKSYNATFICMIVAIVLSIFTSIGYLWEKEITFDKLCVLYILALIMANWLGATLGYDKVKQALSSLKGDQE